MADELPEGFTRWDNNALWLVRKAGDPDEYERRAAKVMPIINRKIEETRSEVRDQWDKAFDPYRAIEFACHVLAHDSRLEWAKLKPVVAEHMGSAVLHEIHAVALKCAASTRDSCLSGHALQSYGAARFLIEAAVYARLIVKLGNEFATRYRAHGAIGQFSLAKALRASGQDVPDSDYDRLKQQRDDVIATYELGEGWFSRYWWAEPYVEGRVTFPKLAEVAGIWDEMAAFYEAASLREHVEGGQLAFNASSGVKVTEPSPSDVDEPARMAICLLIDVTKSLLHDVEARGLGDPSQHEELLGCMRVLAERCNNQLHAVNNEWRTSRGLSAR